MKSRLTSLTAHLPPGQVVRYLIVGIWNTAFGYGLYAGLTALLERRMANGYILAIVLANFISITVSFLGYKWFVFRTKGNYVREWLRCLSVYSGNILLSLIATPGLVFLLRRYFGYTRGAPYLAGAILTGVGVVISFFGHKHISFRQSKPVAAA